MERIVKSMENKYLLLSLELVQEVFAEYDSPEEGKVVRQLVEEIRAKNIICRSWSLSWSICNGGVPSFSIRSLASVVSLNCFFNSVSEKYKVASLIFSLAQSVIAKSAHISFTLSLPIC